MINLLTKTEQTIDPAAPMAVAVSNPPQVLITAPLACARFTAPFDVWAVASDGAAAVQTLNFLVNGKTLATVLTPPYRFKLDAAAYGNQVVDIQAVATAKSGKVSTFTTKVILNRGLASACPATQ